MGREVRMVPADWQHPKQFDTYRGEMRYVPLYEGGFGGGYESARDEWWEGYEQWQKGLCRSYEADERWEPIDDQHKHMRFTEYHGPLPSPDDYMPNWPQEQRTHLMMYEDTTEGTPISPAFKTPEELARWLADTGASAFGGETAPYEAWLSLCKGGYAPSMVIMDGHAQNGVTASLTTPEKD